MMGSYYQRIAAFLSEYTERTADGGPIPPDPVYIRDAISQLISGGWFTKEELKQEALEKYDVIIPDRMFL